MPTKLVLYAEAYLESDSDFQVVSGNLTLNITAHANVSVSATPVLEQLPLTWSSDKALIDAKFSVRSFPLYGLTIKEISQSISSATVNVPCDACKF